MTTTQHLNSTDYFSTPEEAQCYKKNNANNRYPTFQQTHFTAGDEQQFEAYRNRCALRSYCCQSTSGIYSKYCNVDDTCVSNTFKYMFHKFKKGIFMQIKDSTMTVMLPFSKHNYINEWSHLINVNFKVFERIASLDGRMYKPKGINKFVDQWYANNAIFRYEYPVRENDSGIDVLNDMFKVLCDTYTDIPDVEFFVNKRDHPLMRRDGCEPYDAIFGDRTVVSHDYETFAPILSMCSGDEYADIAIPTWDDWARVSIHEQKFFPKCAHHYAVPNVLQDWNDKVAKAVFRGSSTGSGLTIDNNMRLRVSVLSLQYPDILDAGITSWNFRPRVTPEHTIDTFNHSIVETIPIVPFMSFEEQTRFKYIINIDGHVSAYRLASELGSCSVVLLAKSKYKLWFSCFLEPYIHYVPVAGDLSDLIEKIKWCRENDDDCRVIASNAKRLHDTQLCKNGILSFLRNTLITIKHAMGFYEYRKSPLDIVIEHEKVMIRTLALGTSQPTTTPIIPRAFSRSYDLLEGIRRYLMEYDVFKTPQSTRVISKKTTFNIYTIDTFQIIGKTSYDEIELVNEAVIGVRCINPILKYIPNYAFTFGYNTHKNESYVEYIDDTITFYDYILSDKFRMDEYLFILQQLSLAIHVAQQQCFFMHNDLYPWNVLLRRLPTPVDIYYFLQNEYVKITTDIVPYIIDYGKSRGIIDSTYYGVINAEYNSTIHDILCILISSMHLLINKRTLTKPDLHQVFLLSSFFSGTTYTKNKHFNNIRDLKQFLSNSKKYSHMTNLPKYELETKTPFDFVCYLHTVLKCPYTTHARHTIVQMREGTWRQVYDCLSGIDERDACLRVLHRIKHNTLPRNKYYCLAQTEFDRIISSIIRMYPDVIPFDTSNENDLNENDSNDSNDDVKFDIIQVKQFIIDRDNNQTIDIDNIKYFRDTTSTLNIITHNSSPSTNSIAFTSEGFTASNSLT